MTEAPSNFEQEEGVFDREDRGPQPHVLLHWHCNMRDSRKDCFDSNLRNFNFYIKHK